MGRAAWKGRHASRHSNGTGWCQRRWGDGSLPTIHILLALAAVVVAYKSTPMRSASCDGSMTPALAALAAASALRQARSTSATTPLTSSPRAGPAVSCRQAACRSQNCARLSRAARSAPRPQASTAARRSSRSCSSTSVAQKAGRTRSKPASSRCRARARRTRATTRRQWVQARSSRKRQKKRSRRRRSPAALSLRNSEAGSVSVARPGQMNTSSCADRVTYSLCRIASASDTMVRPKQGAAPAVGSAPALPAVCSNAWKTTRLSGL